MKTRKYKPQTKLAACPGCCQNGKAAFTAESDFASEESNELVQIWKCHNCGHTMPRRTNKPEVKITPKQAAVLEKLQATFGGEITHEFIGRKVYVTAKNDARRWFDGQMLYGPIGP